MRSQSDNARRFAPGSVRAQDEPSCVKKETSLAHLSGFPKAREGPDKPTPPPNEIWSIGYSKFFNGVRLTLAVSACLDVRCVEVASDSG